MFIAIFSPTYIVNRPALKQVLTLRRIRDALGDPSMIGRDGVRLRYERIQYCMMLWRLLALVQIPILIAVCPEDFSSPSHAWFIFFLALTTAAIYWCLAMYTKLGGNLYFHYADQAVCAALMLLSREAALLYMMSFYAYASLGSRPTERLREAFPSMAGLSLALLVAVNLTPDPFYSTSLTAGEVVIFYLVGFAAYGFSKVLSRTADLELEARLEEHRQSYRRRLHDDLGNTLCGLHFRIQSLKQKGVNDIRNAVGFLDHGYKHANESLSHLLAGIDIDSEADLTRSLTAIAMHAKKDFGMHVIISQPFMESRLSPAALQEVVYVIKGAITNAAQHARVNEVRVEITRRWRTLRVSISDNGSGFDPEQFALYQKSGSTGIKGMHERAKILGGRLDVASQIGSGTRVTLSFREAGYVGLPQRLAGLFTLSGHTMYRVIIFLKFLIALMILIQVALMAPEMRSETMVWVIGAAVFLEGAIFLLFSARLYLFLNELPWLFYAQQALFLFLLLSAWRSGLPYFLDAAPSANLALSACFLGIAPNLRLASFLGVGMIAANQLAPPTPAMHDGRVEELVVEVISNLLLAVVASLGVEFLASLEKLKRGAVAQAVARQQEQLTSRTYEELHTKILELGKEIEGIRAQSRHGHDFSESIAILESRSRDLTVRLRQIIRSIEEKDLSAAV